MSEFHCQKCGRVVTEVEIMFCEHCESGDWQTCGEGCPICCEKTQPEGGSGAEEDTGEVGL